VIHIYKNTGFNILNLFDYKVIWDIY